MAREEARPDPVRYACGRGSPLRVLEAPGFGLRAAEQRRVALWRQIVGELTTPHYAALVALRAEPGLDHIRVADRIAADKATMTEVTRFLCARDLVETTSDPRDGRRRVLSLLPAGEAALERVAPLVRGVDDLLLAPLDTAARTEVVDLWTRVADSDQREWPWAMAGEGTRSLPAEVRTSLTHSGFVLRRARQQHARLWERLVGPDVTPAQYALLDVLHHDEPLTPGVLARRASVEETTAVRVLRRLAERGELLRAPDPRDARRVLLRLTDSGRALLLEHTTAVNEVQSTLVRPLSPPEAGRLARLSAQVAGLVTADGTPLA
ncbi:MarR family transcriptional regulator [Streptomyces sp. NPDC048278]|uniref:MarR family winged helix-turn-helix transcriptional regulator n=1 Tax=Streptomyces sp. NPDC048278 TaxID=3155809 RepID=UPI0034333324